MPRVNVSYQEMLDEFNKWAQTPGSGLNRGVGLGEQSAGSYLSFLKAFGRNVGIFLNQHHVNRQNLPQVFNACHENAIDPIEMVAALAVTNRRDRAIQFLVILIETIEQFGRTHRDDGTQTSPNAKNLSNLHSALCALILFLEQTQANWQSIADWYNTDDHHLTVESINEMF